jgi:CheY-like chemotaxis protein
LLTFSRRQVMEIKPLDFSNLLAGLVRMLGRLLGDHIELLFYGQAEAVWVEADSGMMEQVVTNLCVNARDAMPNGGRLTIGTGYVELDAAAAQGRSEARAGKFVCLSVADTGCGMDSATMKKAFEPFFTTKEVGKGTGLGLATVFGIVKQHRGWIESESEVGVGSVFHVFLPAREAPASAQAASTSNSFSGGRETILMVEDNESLRMVTSQWLQRLGYLVIEAMNGVEAVGRWKESGGKVDLLLTDMVMPGGMSGLELAEQLRVQKPSLKVILSSGYSLEIARGGTLNGKGIVYLPKPYEGATLATAIRKCFDGA